MLTCNMFGKEIDYYLSELGIPLELGRILIKSKEDFEVFVNNFYQKNRFVTDDLLDFREFILNNRELSCHDFITLCDNTGIFNGFTEMFLQYFTHNDIVFIIKALKNRRTTMQEIYFNFTNNKNENVLRFIMSSM